MVYVPDSLVTMLRVKPVAGLRTTTSTPGITAPDASFTVPMILPVFVCAKDDDASGTKKERNRNTTSVRMFRTMSSSTFSSCRIICAAVRRCQAIRGSRPNGKPSNKQQGYLHLSGRIRAIEMDWHGFL